MLREYNQGEAYFVTRNRGWIFSPREQVQQLWAVDNSGMACTLGGGESDATRCRARGTGPLTHARAVTLDVRSRLGPSDVMKERSAAPA